MRQYNKLFCWLPFLLLGVVLQGCGSAGGGSGAVPSTTTTTTLLSGGTPPATLSLATSLTSVKSDNSQTATITATVLGSSNDAVSGVAVNFSANGGRISKATEITDANGEAKITFSSGTADRSNAVVTITATITGLSGATTIPIRVVGSTVNISATSDSVASDGSKIAQITIAAKDAGGTSVYNAPVTLSFVANPGDGTATLSDKASLSGYTDVNGEFSATLKGTSPGPVTVKAAALGGTATKPFTVDTVGGGFRITAPAADPAGADPCAARAPGGAGPGRSARRRKGPPPAT